MGIQLLGVGLTGLYQIGIIGVSSAVSDSGPGSAFRPCFSLALLKQSDASLLDAEDMPVKLSPGWLTQGEQDQYGDKGVFHGDADGVILPPEVETTLGAALAPHPSFSDVFRFINYADTTKNRIYVHLSASSSIVTRYDFNHPTAKSWHWTVNSIPYYGTCYVERKNGFVRFHWESYGRYFDIVSDHYVTQEALHWDNNPGKPVNISKGRYTRVIVTRSSGSVSTQSSSSSSGLAFHAFSPPVALDSLSSAVIFAGSANKGEASINSDLLALSQISPSNAPWLACQNAVEAKKHLNFQWATYIRDSINVRQLLPPLRKFNSLAKPKMWAELFLWWIYGVKPQYSDTVLLVKKIKPLIGKSFFQIAESYAAGTTTYGTSYHNAETFIGHSVTIKCNARTWLQPRLHPVNKVETLFLFLQSLDIGIDATNVWELIPYSFVVDWFLNTDDLAKWARYLTYSTLYNLRQYIYSIKHLVEIPASRYIANGYNTPIFLHTYVRGITRTFPSEPFDLRFNDPSGHLLEGAALLVAKI